MSFEFKSYSKIPRIDKLVWAITEKLDGTNGIVHITPFIGPEDGIVLEGTGAVAIVGNVLVFAGSRSRWLQPGKQTDNYGFGEWVKANADELVATLGPGTHYGEWWGQGIQRNYGATRKRFTLFAPWRYPQVRDIRDETGDEVLTKVPLLAQGSGSARSIQTALDLWEASLLRDGSPAVPGFMNPEGMVLTLGNQNYKVILNDGPKEASRG